MFKRLAMLALLSVLVLSAKTYTFNISDNATIANVQLKPGEYHVKLAGSQVVLTDQAGNQIDATPKVETADHKFDHTAVIYSTADGTNRILSVELGGSSNRVVFESGGM
jgi:hypothetical protein